METNQPFGSNSPMDIPGYGQTPVPNAVGALVLGIISIPTCICYGVIGLICGIIAIVLGSRAIMTYNQDPNRYTRASFNNANAGRICGIIGTVLSALFFVYVIVVLIIYGTLASSAFEQMLHRMHK